MASVATANLVRRYEFKLPDNKVDRLARHSEGRVELKFQNHFLTMWDEGPWVQIRRREN